MHQVGAQISIKQIKLFFFIDFMQIYRLVSFQQRCFDHLQFYYQVDTATHAHICLTVGIIIFFLISSLGSAKGRLEAFWHLRGVNCSPGEAVWLSHNPPRPRRQHSPNHSDSQMVCCTSSQPSHISIITAPIGKAVTSESQTEIAERRWRIPASRKTPKQKVLV